jgi:general secretion pathway protein J
MMPDPFLQELLEAVNGFTPMTRSAVNGFTPMTRSAVNGFTPMTRSAVNGFTLVELMVALFIFALLTGAGVALLSVGARTQRATEARLDILATETRMVNMLAGDFAQTLPRPVRDQVGATVPAFVGTNGTGAAPLLRYTRNGWSNPDEARRASIQRVEITLSEGRLERRIRTMADGAALSAPVMLADGIEGVAMRYRDKTGWKPSWSDARPDAMPRAVQITLNRKSAPPLTMMFLVGAGS